MRVINKIFRFPFRLSVLVLLILASVAQVSGQSLRQERRLINAGNDLYGEGKYAEAIRKYKSALETNAESDVARFNLGLAQIRQSERSGKQEKDSVSSALYAQGSQLLEQVAQLGVRKADLSSKANYNLGNLQFEKEDYGGAIRYYKQALRLNPSFENARRNLRIAQLRLQNQQDDKNDDKQDQNKDQNQDQQDQNKDNQDKNQDQQDRNQDQQDQNNDRNKDQQNQQQDQPRENEINPQAAQQILNAVENNEARTRARQGSNNGEKAVGAGGRQRKW